MKHFTKPKKSEDPSLDRKFRPKLSAKIFAVSKPKYSVKVLPKILVMIMPKISASFKGFAENFS